MNGILMASFEANKINSLSSLLAILKNFRWLFFHAMFDIDISRTTLFSIKIVQGVSHVSRCLIYKVHRCLADSFDIIAHRFFAVKHIFSFFQSFFVSFSVFSEEDFSACIFSEKGL